MYQELAPINKNTKDLKETHLREHGLVHAFELNLVSDPEVASYHNYWHRNKHRQKC
jgi:hypothetical protein